MTNGLFIATYRGDFPWLRACLRSIKLHWKGMTPPCVCTDSVDFADASRLVRREFPAAAVVVHEPLMASAGYLRAQCAMLTADLKMPEADVIWFLGSDCVFTDTFDPFDWMVDRKPRMRYLRHDSVGDLTAHWRRGVKAAIGYDVEYEFMRHLPLAYPRELLPYVRARIEEHTRMPWEQYVFSTTVEGSGRDSEFSESNVIGSYAWVKRRDIYAWWYDATCKQHFPVKQFWSHGGLEHVEPRDGRSQRVMLEEFGLLDAYRGEVSTVPCGGKKKGGRKGR